MTALPPTPSPTPPPTILPTEILLLITHHYLTTIISPSSTYPPTHPFHTMYWQDAAVLSAMNFLAVFPHMRSPLYAFIKLALLRIHHTRDLHTEWLEASRRTNEQSKHERLWKELWDVRRGLAGEEECLMFLRGRLWEGEVEVEKSLLCWGEMDLREGFVGRGLLA